MSGWRKLWRKLLRAWRRSDISCFLIALTFDLSPSLPVILTPNSWDLNVSLFTLQVYIIAHVPVGYLPFARNTTAIRESHNERLVAIFREYSDVIAGHFYGHTHRDSIMVLLDQQGND